MRFSVEAWAPEYGTSAEGVASPLDESTADVDVSVEVDAGAWVARRPPPGVRPVEDLVVVDGVRRIEAHVWITEADGTVRQGIAASYGAGAVRCDGQARLIASEVRRGLFTASTHADAIETVCGRFEVNVAGADDPDDLSLLLQRRMGAIENEVAASAAAVLTLVDGPLKLGQEHERFVGYVKTHHKTYGTEIVREVVTALGVGERTPLFLVRNRPRYSWYLRLPCDRSHGWEGVVRLEAPATRPAVDVAATADRLSLTLPRLASTPTKDARAPQNLFPIAGLERDLRHRLGDAALVWRALRRASKTAP